MVYRSNTKKYSGSFYTSSGSRVRQHGGQQGQGSMNAFYSGSSQLVRHSVAQSLLFPTPPDNGKLADQKAIAMPLVVFGANGSGNTSANPDESSSATIASGSRVNNVQLELQITQADTSKPNNCYIGFIATSFSDAALNDENMTTNFNDLISMANADTGTMDLSGGEQTMKIEEYNESPFQKHWIRGFNKYAYTLYSGRPAILKTVLPTPPKCRRAQFGMGWWIVLLNDSSAIQGEDAGSGTSINFSFNTYFKEIQDLRAEYRATP